ncbi:hypothetical protein GC176_18370 [bacterium]|nr:hypothetical protein [bacterium]
MNPLSPRKMKTTETVCRYYTVDRSQIQRIVNVPNDRVMRDILQQLFQAGLINKTRMQAVSPGMGSAAPVYFPTRKGAELVAAEFGDERYLYVCTRTPDWMHLLHWIGVAEFHLRLDQALEFCNNVECLGWFGEWDEVNPHGTTPQERFRIYTLITEKPRLVCAPDAVFALRVDGVHSKMFFLELDRGTSSLQQIVKSKFPGFAALAERRLHRRLFDTSAELFTVLHISMSAARRDHLRKIAIGHPAAELHRFACMDDWTPEGALTNAIFYGCDDDTPQAIVRVPKEVAV